MEAITFDINMRICTAESHQAGLHIFCVGTVGSARLAWYGTVLPAQAARTFCRKNLQDGMFCMGDDWLAICGVDLRS